MKSAGNGASSIAGDSILAVIFKPAHLRRTGLTALVVGSWLTAVNQWDVLATGGFSLHLALKIGMNFLTPFVVANVGLLSRKGGL